MATNQIISPNATVVPINTSGPPGEYTIAIGRYHYLVKLSKVPWLGAYIDLVPRVNASYTQPGYESEYEPDESVPYLFIAIQGIRCKYNFCFEMLPPELSITKNCAKRLMFYQLRVSLQIRSLYRDYGIQFQCIVNQRLLKKTEYHTGEQLVLLLSNLCI
ncbi:hypothetical protein EAE96_004333 [Botrytis aclada]|nr:hypothetical protein EAE96_004333 [Botrytis aclada]